ncbi:LysR family transcriptional regulator [Brevibacillus sp. SYP-B805]|uniref:LysR family transcriptional regulator n=1 Tax=Brevibacillus sp. SYP-B805 TaxID=1578199 RepID=UPI0013EB2B1F|nr:LysR family transcriptional regulator [Brevibacillus sp. SYP-B805]NGQ95902.1 LysR family transcriptional regulator [Brevibacillus sp. SYP-B805]
MENRDWLILRELYRQKNITKAAESLFLSQPALTKRIRQIEKEFGVQIVHRGRRGVHFTPQGEYLVKCAEEMLLRLRQITEHLANMDNRVAGTIRLGVSNYFTRYQLPGLLKRFKTKYPDVEFQVITGWSKDVFKMVYNQDVHVGFVRGNYHWRGRKHLLFEEPICIVSQEKINLEDLPRLPRIDYETDDLLKALIENWWAENYTQPPLIGMEVDKADTCREMVANGLGYAILPRLVLSGKEELFTLNLTDHNGDPILRRTWMFYHEESLALKMVNAFVRFIEETDMSTPL